MKYILGLLIIPLLLSCNSDKGLDMTWEKNASTIVSGTITPYNVASMPKKMKFYFYGDIFDQKEFDVSIDSTGNFIATFELPHPQDVNFYYKNWLSLLVKPGDSVHLNFDGNQVDKADLYKSMVITGNGIDTNTKFHDFLVQDTILRNYYRPYSQLSPEEFTVYHDSIFKLRGEFISNFLKNNPDIDPFLKSWLNTEKTIVPVTKIVEFPMYYRMYNRGKMDSLGYPDGFFARVKELNQITEDNFTNGNLGTLSNQLLFHYYDKVDKSVETQDRIVKDSLLFRLLKKDFPDNPIPIQLAISDRVRADLESMNTSFIKRNFDQLKMIYADSDIGTAIFKAYEDTVVELENTSLPEGVEFLSFESTNPKDYLGEIIKKAKGKIVYIDHWATWCAPCRGEFKNALPSFKDKFKDKIEFVYLCYSSEEDEWKPLIRKFQLSGMHYFVPEDENTVLHEQMTVDGYPTYTIINQKGEIVKSDFQYRPSRDITTKIIDSLLQNTQSL